MRVGLLIELGLLLLLLLGFLSQLIFLYEVECLLRLGEPVSHLSAIPVPIRLLVPLGLLIQVGLRYQKFTKLDFSISYHI